MSKETNKYFMLSLSIETPGATEDEISEFLTDVVRVVEEYGYTTGGGIREVNEDGSEIAEDNAEGQE